jgi:hypothetical protein
MTYVTSGERIGYERGQQELLIRQLQKRMGELPQSSREQIQSLSVNQLETLGEALLDFTGLDDLLAWLAVNPVSEKDF